MSESCGIHRVVELPAGLFDDANSIRLVLLTLIKGDRRIDVRKTGVAKFNRTELPENARGLLEQPLDDVLKNRHGRYDAEVVGVSHEDLEGENAARILSNPSIHSIITSDGFTKLGEVSGVRAGSGVRTGNNEFFYFDEEEKESSDIDDRFFRPAIKNPSDETRKITLGDIDLYLLDLNPYTDELESQGVEISEDAVVEELERDGHEELADYIEQEPGGYNRKGPKFEVDYRGMFENPDLVISELFDSPRCYHIEVDDVVFDSTMIGIQTENDQMRDSLARLLNTPLYKGLLQTYADSMNLDWYRLNISSLRDIPIIGGALSQDLLDRTDSFFPPDDDNDLVSLNHVLMESCEDGSESQAVGQYLASRDDYAWSWFMKLSEFEDFQEVLEDDEGEAREFVVDHFDEDLLDQIRYTFENIEFFEERRELMDDLLMEFEEDQYRGFLAGIVPQFEGVLADLVEETGGEIIREGQKTEFRMPGETGSRNKSLAELISVFFDGMFSTFLDENVRERRNEIAHGAVVENSRELSIHFLISFYALCNASMSEYVNRVDRDQSASSA